MTDVPASDGMGLTARMVDALKAITEFVGRHGAMPTRRALADVMGCNPNNANRLMDSLVERGELSAVTRRGWVAVAGFGRDGVLISVRPHIAARLAAYCAANGEKVTAVADDAIQLHLDQLEGDVATVVPCGDGVAIVVDDEEGAAS
ncbi:ABC transporter permease [Bradyrhizobium quebecense]|uniref:ABC transporter permease n=2 Tax=Bradyrhizobium quebecense TaxID=2748629 RepID=A0ACD3VA31_9BRAD|nr:ABC transporter permease [Bradyrhizobium quebecense]UGA47126.1 ABC transporter permease [Bradyrhizobium quebecense]UGY03248.1 ABC transporter permease [Bradyrhizobium quebecense]